MEDSCGLGRSGCFKISGFHVGYRTRSGPCGISMYGNSNSCRNFNFSVPRRRVDGINACHFAGAFITIRSKTYSAFGILGMAILGKKACRIGSAVYGNSICGGNTFSNRAASKACASSILGATSNYSSVTVLRLAMLSLIIPISLSVYRNNKCELNSELLARSNVCESAIAGSHNYSSVAVLALSIISACCHSALCLYRNRIYR